jgi:hypothetical protein
MPSVFDLPFHEAESYFKDKLNIPTDKWNDLVDEEHAKAFMTAGAKKADLLADFRKAVDAAIDGKMPLPEFQKRFDEIVKQHGWQYHGTRNWRSELIWSQNISTAYQAGRWQQFANSDAEYLVYRHQDGQMNPRRTHQAWNGTVLPKDDPWWNTHGVPNGFGCKCRIYRSNQGEADRAFNKGKRPDNVPPDKGFAYNPGTAGLKNHEEVLGRKLDKLPPDIASKLRAEQMAARGMKAPASAPAVVQHSGTSKPFQKQVDDALALVNERIHQRLAKAGYTVETGDMLVNMKPSLKGHLTSDGRMWETVGAAFSNKRAMIAEKVMHQITGKIIANSRVSSGVLHEYGHAWDDLTGFTKLKVFQDAFNADLVKLGNIQGFDYFTGSASETFAELFAEHHGHSSGWGVSSYFPKTAALVKKMKRA